MLIAGRVLGGTEFPQTPLLSPDGTSEQLYAVTLYLLLLNLS
jgi:hypothetical protein